MLLIISPFIKLILGQQNLRKIGKVGIKKWIDEFKPEKYNVISMKGTYKTSYPWNIIFDGEKWREDRENISHEIYEYLKDKIKPKRGDICQFSEYEERENTTEIFDGEKFIPLADEPSDYGNIPEQFLIVDEFPYDYFKDLMYVNWVPFDFEKYIDKIKKHLEYSKDFKNWKNFKEGKKCKYIRSKFMLNEQKVKLLFFVKNTNDLYIFQTEKKAMMRMTT